MTSGRCKATGQSSTWSGGVRRTTDGYVEVWMPEHPRARTKGYVRQHVLVVERAIGKYLHPRHPIHHVNEIRPDNRPENLVVCEDNAYHRLLHVRMAALSACGNANALKCYLCKSYERQEDITVSRGRQTYGRHKSCIREANRARSSAVVK